MLGRMDDTLTIQFSKQDADQLRSYKEAIDGPLETEPSSGAPMQRHSIVMPEVTAGTKRATAEVEDALESGNRLRRTLAASLPKEILEGAKAAFIATGGNISEVASMYSLAPQSVLLLAQEESWAVYAGGTKVVQSMGRSQLMIMRDKLWAKIEVVIDSLEIEKKKKKDLTQHRAYSEYVEPIASRNAVFKNMMDQYMRIQTLLEPEFFANDPDSSNFQARRARESQYPGGIEGVNREMADFFSEVVVGIADKLKDRDLNGYSHLIDTSAANG